MKIITITLNPVFDIFYDVDGFEKEKENRVKNIVRDLGGKGLNVSKALSAVGVDSAAHIIVGEQSRGEVVSRLDDYRLDHKDFFVPGKTRENLTIRSEGQKETRICTDNFEITSEMLDAFASEAGKDIDENTIVVCSGRFPRGITRDEAKNFVRFLKKKTPYVVLDTNYFTAGETFELCPWMIKPNDEEILIYGGDDYEKAAEFTHSSGISHVFVSLGGDGAYYCGELGKFRAKVPEIDVVSTIGAGDSTVAGFLYGYINGLGAKEIIASACALGSAACLQEGVNTPEKEDWIRIKEQIEVAEA